MTCSGPVPRVASETPDNVCCLSIQCFRAALIHMESVAGLSVTTGVHGAQVCKEK